VVDLLAFVHPDALPTPDSLSESQTHLGKFCASVEYFPLWAKQSRVHKIAALLAGAASQTPFSMIAHRSRAFQARVNAALAKNAYDVVHVDTIGLAPFVDLDRSEAATVLTHHNIESMLMGRRGEVERSLLSRILLKREAHKLATAEAMLAPRFDLNLTMSVNDRDHLTRLAPAARTAVVPNGVDIDYFTPRPELETPALIYGGGMNMFANRDAVMSFIGDVWPLIRAQRPDVKFFAVGQDPPPELLEASTADKQIIVTGYVDDIRKFIWQAAVYVVPLRVGGGTRLKVLDAMSLGKAIVSTSIGCEGIDAINGRHLEIADTPHRFADATLALLSSSQRRRRLGTAARELVAQRYSWPVIGDQLRSAYASAAEAANRRRGFSPRSTAS
jgi:polysaccharide biosynthesis protein PslH